MLKPRSKFYKVIKLALGQFTSEALQRIISWRGKMLLDGGIYRTKQHAKLMGKAEGG